jgi:hypothetical protein
VLADIERDPVSSVRRSASATRNPQTSTLDNAEPTHSFSAVLTDLATIQRTTCHDAISGATFLMTTTATEAQQHAHDLLDSIRVGRRATSENASTPVRDGGTSSSPRGT